MRNKTKVRKKKKEPSQKGDIKQEEPKQGSRIKAFDYQSWEKFDVVTSTFISNQLHIMGGFLSNQRCLCLWLQDQALAAMDKEESPVESNESDSEDSPVDQERALAEKDNVNAVKDNVEKQSSSFFKRLFLTFRETSSSEMRSTMML